MGCGLKWKRNGGGDGEYGMEERRNGGGGMESVICYQTVKGMVKGKLHSDKILLFCSNSMLP